MALELSLSSANAKETLGKVTKQCQDVGGVFTTAHDTETRKATNVFETPVLTIPY